MYNGEKNRVEVKKLEKFEIIIKVIFFFFFSIFYVF